jgi:ribosomal protein L19E
MRHVLEAVEQGDDQARLAADALKCGLERRCLGGHEQDLDRFIQEAGDPRTDAEAPQADALHLDPALGHRIRGRLAGDHDDRLTGTDQRRGEKSPDAARTKDRKPFHPARLAQ